LKEWGLQRRSGLYDMVAFSLAMVDEVKARAKANPTAFDLFPGIYSAHDAGRPLHPM
jgi:hypothetical protein